MHSLEKLLQSLEQHGYAVSDTALPIELAEELFTECQSSWMAGLFQPAHVGRGEMKSQNPQVRGDSILWLNTGQNAASTRFLEWTTELRRELNQRYYLGLRREEFHFARYPLSQGYQKHWDQHQGQNDRKISLVYYLNPAWSPTDGGELCLYSAENESLETQRIQPQKGRLVLFQSDLIPHEVLPCFQIRWSLTGWFRTDF